ncbi:uncharacterized protein LOC116805579 isoform X2 [Drosophila grimshawi]|uniref:uncharacterized protein LOC116805579 isoform X2 n=1 Tax=Drosophila grimshawi TaxID=7222 RepID=UPI001C934F4C|nr:uncharacterized protein LOC116805579 isoform X2 [Drosophila grimshawi]
MSDECRPTATTTTATAAATIITLIFRDIGALSACFICRLDIPQLDNLARFKCNQLPVSRNIATTITAAVLATALGRAQAPKLENRVPLDGNSNVLIKSTCGHLTVKRTV